MKYFLLFLICSGLSFSQSTNMGNDKERFGSEVNTYTEKAEKIGNVFFNNQNQFKQESFGGNVSNVTSDKVRSFTTVTEEDEPNKGRIWSIFGIENPDPTMPDLIKVSYSDDNGASWTGYQAGILNANQVLYPDQIDAEIVGKTFDPTQDKYLYIAYTYATGSYVSGQKKTGIYVINTTNGVGGLYSLNFPGGADNQYYDLRVTSDNEKYFDLPFVYFVCTIDSTLPGGDIVCMQRMARITDPFNFLNNSAVMYRVAPLEQYITVSGAIACRGHSDIVFLPVPTDKLYYSLSHLNSDGIWINNTLVWGPNTSEVPHHVDIGMTITDHKMAASFDDDVAQIMLLATRGVSGSSDDLVSYKLDMRMYSSQFAVISSGTGGAIPREPKIVSPRYVNDDYRVSYMMNIGSNPDHADSILFVKSIKAPGNQWGTTSRVSLRTGTHNWRSKYSAVGIKLNSADNTLVFWSQDLGGFGFVGSELWCTFNSGTPTGVDDNEITPSDFSLSQNYPNPFNPTTTINYSILKLSNVVIKVYDVLGKEAATLVNEEKPAGTYEVEFDASKISSGVYLYKLQAGSFVETKKMILIK